MSENEKNLPPRIYHQNDPDGILKLWKDLVAKISTEFRQAIIKYDQITDPDTAPIEFVDLMLAQLGSPFSDFPLTDIQKRKLVRLLIPMYNQKGLGKEKGIAKASKFLMGFDVEIIDPHAYPEDGWHVGASELGLSTYAGGRRLYCNILNWSEDFTVPDWIKTDLVVFPDETVGPTPWSRPADRLDMSAPGAEIYQEVTPFFTGDEDFAGSIFLKAKNPISIKAIIQSVDDPLDSSEAILNITTNWQRFTFQHKFFPVTGGNVRFILRTDDGIPDDLYAWGAELVRDDNINTPYAQTTNNAADGDRPGAWVFHFFIQTPQIIDEDEEALLRVIADFMKPAHTHYGIIQPVDPGFVDHWEVGVSEVGINTFVH